MNRAELREILRGLVVVATTPMDDDYELDLGNMYEITQWWVESGVVTGRACIKIASVMGEVPQLRDSEFGPLVRTVVQAADGRVPIIAGIHDKDTIRTIEDAKTAQDLGGADQTGARCRQTVIHTQLQQVGDEVHADGCSGQHGQRKGSGERPEDVAAQNFTGGLIGRLLRAAGVSTGTVRL